MSSFALVLLGCIIPPQFAPVDTGSDDGGGTQGDGGSPGDGGATDGGGQTDGGGSTGSPVINVLVEAHPEVATLLIVRWEQTSAADEAWVRYQFEGQWHETPRRALAEGPQEEVLLGIPADTEVLVDVYNRVDGVDLPGPGAREAQTGALPGDLVTPTLVIYEEAATSPEPYLLTSVDVGSYDFYGPCYTVILDREGRIVWYRKTSGSRLTMFPRVSASSGHVTIDATSYYSYGEEPSITRVRLDMTQEEVFELPGFGFTYSEDPEGNFYFDYAQTGTEYHLERLLPDGERERIWSCYPWMSEYTSQYWGCAVNTVLFDAERNTVLWSMFETSTVAEIDADSGELLRYFGQTPDGWEIVPQQSMLELQHYPNWTPDGTLITTTHVPRNGTDQVIREFQLDDETQTVTELWSYIPEAGWYGDYEGDVARLDNGNTLIGYGTAGAMQEIDAESQVVWELTWEGHLTGHMTLVDDLYALNQGW